MTDRWRYACPECGSRDLSRRTRDGGFRCNANGHVFPASARVDLKARSGQGGVADA
jgi:ribosomal protein L37AE/L43A